MILRDIDLSPVLLELFIDIDLVIIMRSLSAYKNILHNNLLAYCYNTSINSIVCTIIIIYSNASSNLRYAFINFYYKHKRHVNNISIIPLINHG